MDRPGELVALWVIALCATGCTAPQTRREAQEQAADTHAGAATQAPEQSVAAVEETLRKLSTDVGQSPSGEGDAADSRESTAAELSPREVATSNVNTARKTASAKQPGRTEPAVDRETLLEVIDQMQAAGVLDAKARGQLLDDLKQTDPSLWPQLLAYFQASLARETRSKEKPSAIRRASAVQAERIEGADEVIVSDEQEVAQPPRRATATADKAAQPAQSSDAIQQATKPPVASPSNSLESEPTQKSVAAAPVEKAVVGKALAVTTPAKAAERGELEWREHLAAAIAGLEKETSLPPDSSAAIGRHAALRLLYLADGRRGDAVKPIAGVPAAQQDFWSKELFGLATYLDTESNRETGHRAAEAGLHLQGAVQRLAELAALQVKNVSFCTEVSSFGVYKKFEQYEFQAGQEVLLYAEVENFRSESTDKGFHTAFKASYQILDSHGARVAEHEFKLTEEYCQNPRRDYFTNYFVWLPKRIYGGTYTLQLTLEDVKAQKIGQSSIEFTIKEKP